MNNFKNYFLGTALVGTLCFASDHLSFGQNLVTDGTFSNLSVVQSGSTVGAGLNSATNPNYTTGDTLASWTSQGYNFIFTNGNAGSTSVTGADGALSLYGPGNGIANGLTTPPGGGNVIAMDGVYEQGPLTQVINGLQSGRIYTVSFEWAGAQQSGFTGATTEGLSVALGAATGVFTGSDTLIGGQSTTEVSDPYEGFTGWMSQSFNFTATSSSETLYFLANGTPSGQPPFTLLGDVTLVPEAKDYAYWTLLFGILIMVGNRVRRRYQQSTATNP